jgi:hypothetical protein
MVFALAGLMALPAAAATWRFRAEEHSQIEANGQEQADARLLVTDAPGRYLVDLPSESKCVLIDVSSGSAILLMRNEVKRVKGNGPGGAILVDQRSALDTPSYALHTEGQALEFQTDISFVHVELPRPSSEAEVDGAEKMEVPPAAASPELPAVVGVSMVTESPGSWTPSATGSDAARACVRLDASPSSLTPACTKSVYVRNSCDTAVVALIRETQHLMSGSLSETISVLVPPNGTNWVGCSWWSGAMAPAMHDLIGAGFLEPPPHHERGGHHGGKTH